MTKTGSAKVSINQHLVFNRREIGSYKQVAPRFVFNKWKPRLRSIIVKQKTQKNRSEWNADNGSGFHP